jgi:hypothetical protein
MAYSGHVRNGVIVLDDAPALPDGAAVRVELVGPESPGTPTASQARTAGERLMRYAGKAVGLPPDASSAHDTYLYGDLPE